MAETTKPSGQKNRVNDRKDRRERAAQMRREQQRAERRRNLIFIITAVVVALGLLAAAIVPSLLSHKRKQTPIAGLITVTDLKPGEHKEGTIHYDQTPPLGGPHNPVWLNCGAYDKPVASENAVHDLEHGAVWITYQPDLPKDQVTKLQDLVKNTPFLTVSPFPKLPAPVVASAWGYQVRLKSASDPRLAEFIKRYRQGPQTPEPGATCKGGTGNPVVVAANQA